MSTTFVPPRDTDGVPLHKSEPFASDAKVHFKGHGMSGTHTKNSTTNIQFKLPDVRFFNGIAIILRNHVWGDTATMQVVDVDGVIAPAGTMLSEFATDWCFDDTAQSQGAFVLPYKATVPKDLYIRIVYTSTGTTNDVDAQYNLFLHEDRS